VKRYDLADPLAQESTRLLGHPHLELERLESKMHRILVDRANESSNLRDHAALTSMPIRAIERAASHCASIVRRVARKSKCRVALEHFESRIAPSSSARRAQIRARFSHSKRRANTRDRSSRRRERPSCEKKSRVLEKFFSPRAARMLHRDVDAQLRKCQATYSTRSRANIEKSPIIFHITWLTLHILDL
jgi:hypothetical protein